MFYGVQPSVNSDYGKIFTTNALLSDPKTTYTEDELINNVSEGVYISEIFGKFNPSGNSFSFRANGCYIKNGSIMHPVRGVVINGDLPGLLNRIKMVGNNAERIIDVIVLLLLIDGVDIRGTLR